MIAWIYILALTFVNYVISLVFLSPVSVSNPYSLVLWILQFSIINFGISTVILSMMTLHVKKYEYKPTISLREIFYFSLSNLHNIALISFIGFILTNTLILSPVYFLSIAALTVAGYQGFDCINEGFRQLFARKKYFAIIVPYVLASFFLIIIFSFSANYLNTYFYMAAYILAISSAIQWLLYGIAMKNAAYEYILWGQKICIYCGKQVPLEANYCNKCGNRLRG